MQIQFMKFYYYVIILFFCSINKIEKGIVRCLYFFVQINKYMLFSMYIMKKNKKLLLAIASSNDINEIDNFINYKKSLSKIKRKIKID